MGHEAIFHESPTFPALLNSHSHDQCLQAVQRSDLVLCLIDRRYGGRYAGGGSEYKKDLNISVRGRDRSGKKKTFKLVVKGDDLSITWLELIAAYENGIPVVTFARQRTLDEKETRRANQFLGTFRPSYAEANQIFDMLDWITKQKANNWITSFNTVVDYEQKLKAWIGELDRTIATSDSSRVVGDMGDERSDNPVGRFAVIVEGEVDRLFVSELVQKLELNANFVIVPTYGKRNAIDNFNNVVAPYAKIFDEVIILLDSDSSDSKAVAKENTNLRKLIGSRINIRHFLAIPSIEAWISAGFDSDVFYDGVIDKSQFKKNFGTPSINHVRNLLKHKFDLDRALDRNTDLRAFVDHLRSVSIGSILPGI